MFLALHPVSDTPTLGSAPTPHKMVDSSDRGPHSCTLQGPWCPGLGSQPSQAPWREERCRSSIPPHHLLPEALLGCLRLMLNTNPRAAVPGDRSTGRKLAWDARSRHPTPAKPYPASCPAPNISPPGQGPWRAARGGREGGSVHVTTVRGAPPLHSGSHSRRARLHTTLAPRVCGAGERGSRFALCSAARDPEADGYARQSTPHPQFGVTVT